MPGTLNTPSYVNMSAIQIPTVELVSPINKTLIERVEAINPRYSGCRCDICLEDFLESYARKEKRKNFVPPEKEEGKVYCPDCGKELPDNLYCEICDYYYSLCIVCNKISGDDEDCCKEDYNYAPNFGDDIPDKAFGVELEMERIEKHVKTVFNPSRERFYFKNDGSLNDGVEVVSYPLSYTKQMKSWDWLDNISNLKSHDTSTCGLHIHINRKAFKDENHMLRFIAFVNFQKELCVKIARRESQDYSKFKHIYISTEKYNLEKKNGDKYEAVNTAHTDTLEIRIFKGTTKKDTLLASIQFVDAIRAFTDKYSIASIFQKRTQTHNDFIHFVQHSKYKILKTYMKEREII